MVSYLLASLCGAAVLAADQLTKHYVSSNFVLGESREFISGFIDITYIHNRGGAWGMLYGYTYILLPVTVIIMLLCVFLYIRYAKNSRLVLWAMTLVLSGGIGNMIDRIFRDGNVVDFLHFEFFPSFPVFNIADCAIVAGAGLLILYFIIDSVKESKLKKAGASAGGDDEKN